MKRFFLTAILLFASFAAAQTSQPTVREHPGAKDAIAADKSLYLFVRYEGGNIGEMILANLPPTSVEQDGARLKVAKELGASDLYITSGLKPMIRLHGNLLDLPADPPGFEARRDAPLRCHRSLSILGEG